MKKFFINAIAFVISATAYSQTGHNEIQEVVKTVAYYLDGGTLGDSVLFSKAFHRDGQMWSSRNDTIHIVLLKDFMARAKNNKVKLLRTTAINSIQVYETIAQATVTTTYDTFILYDLLLLLKTNDGWKIISKVFLRKEKTEPMTAQ